MLEKTIEMNLLYDFYSQLLTDKQQILLELYYLEDWSLGEIAEQQQVSRQAVFDSLKRAKGSLLELEKKLQLVHKHQARQQLAKELLQNLDSYPEAKRMAEGIISDLLALD